MPAAKARPATFAEYLAGATPKQRAVLKKLRKAVHAAAPGAQECISYGLAAFKLDGRTLVGFGAWTNHCAFYPMSSSTVAAFQDELQGFETSKGTVRFTIEKPLPAALVRKLVQARVVENAHKTRRTGASARPPGQSAKGSSKADVQAVLRKLKRLSQPRIREEMSSRYGIVTRDAFGVRMRDMQRVAKEFGRNHELALALWETGNYEARIVAGYVAEPDRLTPAVMDRWCRDFDNWAVCDTLCFKLFDQVPSAFAMVPQWAARPGEFQKRAAFALIACLAAHDETAGDNAFLPFLPLIEAAATDGRNFVKKGVSWGLRGLGGRSAVLKSRAVALARKLLTSDDSTARWIGKDALRALA